MDSMDGFGWLQNSLYFKMSWKRNSFGWLLFPSLATLYDFRNSQIETRQRRVSMYLQRNRVTSVYNESVLWHPDMHTSDSIYIAFNVARLVPGPYKHSNNRKYVKKKFHHLPLHLPNPFCSPKLIVTVWCGSFCHVCNGHCIASLQITTSFHIKRITFL